MILLFTFESTKQVLKTATLLSSMFACACTTPKTASLFRDQRSYTAGYNHDDRVYNRKGVLVSQESYYISNNGKKILDGKCEEWSDPGSDGKRRVYKDGVLVSSSFIGIDY